MAVPGRFFGLSLAASCIAGMLLTYVFLPQYTAPSPPCRPVWNIVFPIIYGQNGTANPKYTNANDSNPAPLLFNSSLIYPAVSGSIALSEAELTVRNRYQAQPPLPFLDKIYFIITSGVGTFSRLDTLYNSWVKYVKPEHRIIVAEEANLQYDVVTFPFLAGLSSHLDSCLRPYAAMMDAFNSTKYRQYDWFLIADDDTYVNVRQLQLNLLMWNINPDTPVMIGWAFPDTPPNFSGGAGMLLSRRAFELIAAGSLNGVCPDPLIAIFQDKYCHDQLWPMCLRSQGGLFVHSRLFCPAMGPTDTFGRRDRAAQITYHHLSMDQLRSLGEEWPYSGTLWE